MSSGKFDSALCKHKRAPFRSTFRVRRSNCSSVSCRSEAGVRRRAHYHQQLEAQWSRRILVDTFSLTETTPRSNILPIKTIQYPSRFAPRLSACSLPRPRLWP